MAKQAYVYSGTEWVPLASEVTNLSAYQTKALNQYPNRNLIINGAMQVAQRSTSVSGITSTGYWTADRWAFMQSSLGTWTNTVENDAPTGSGFRKSFKLLCTTADASPAASDYAVVIYQAEGQDLQRIKKGTASAEQLTLSFWVKSNVTGTHSVMLYDNDNARFVSFTYSITASGTWEYETITIPADTTGAFDNDNQSSLQLYFNLGAGSSYTGGAAQTTWSGSAFGTQWMPSQTNIAAATNNYWQVTGIQLEIGNTATPFEFKKYADEFRDCQRYYQVIAYIMGTCLNSTTITGRTPFPVTMRANPTISGTGVLNWQSDGLGGNTTQSSFGVTNNNSVPDALSADFTNYTGLTAGRHGTLAYPANNSNRITASAEL